MFTLIFDDQKILCRGVKKSLIFSRDHSTTESLEQVKLWNAAHLFSDDLKVAMKAAVLKAPAIFGSE